MKTTYYTSLGDQNTARIARQCKHRNPNLPVDAFHEKLYQTYLQWSLIGYEDPGYNFFVDASKDVQMKLEDPIGTIQLRIDYDAVEQKRLEEEKGAGNLDMLFDQAITALCEPHNPLWYPEHGPIRQIRVKIKLTEDLIVERTWWPVEDSYNEMTDEAKQFE